MKWIWMAAGAVLMGLAVWMALRGGGISHAIEALADANAAVVVALLTLPLASWLLTSTLFWALTRRFGRVRWTEMCALIGASWLLNNVPMRPGMVGRVTYHRLVNGIPVLASVRVMMESLICSATAGAIGVAAFAAAAGQGLVAVGVGALAVVGAIAAVLGLRRRGTPLPMSLLLAGTGIRIVDTGTWVLRYWLLLRLVGVPVTGLEAMGITIASLIASTTPVPFGLREWAVGASASLFGGAGAARTMLSMGLAADVLHRGIELMLAIPVGLAGAWLMSERLGAVAARRRSEQIDPPERP